MPHPTFTCCPLCQTDSFERRYRLSQVQVFRCANCGMTFLNPYTPPSEMTAIYTNRQSMQAVNPRLSSYYDRIEGSQTERFYDFCIDRLSNWIPGEGGRLLDIGCGRGHFLWRAKQHGWDVQGIEPSEENCRYMKERFQVEAFQTPFEEYHPDGAYDCVSLWDLIEHVPNPIELLRKAKSLLKPEGFLLVATPNHASLINFLADFTFRCSLGQIRFPLETLFVPEHVLYFTSKTLRRVLKISGFRIVDEIRTGTDIDRYQTGQLFRWTARILLTISRWLHWENRIVVFAQKGEEGP